MELKRALISVYDKSGLEGMAKVLAAAGVEMVSSGGTAQFLVELGFEVTEVSEVTGFGEMLDGRVKTLHPRIHAGLLADLSNDQHVEQLAQQEIAPFQLVICNLYPFAETAADPASTEKDIIEKIDIGGPSMVRAAAKNHAHVAVVTSPDQYEEVAAAVEANGFDYELLRRLAHEAFEHTAQYDAAVAGWFGREESISLSLAQVSPLRYGENPHQSAALYSDGSDSWWSTATVHQGKAMSFNNYADSEAAYRLAHALPAPAAVVVKHTNPCGAAIGNSVADAFAKAWAGDPLAAFGGVIAANVPINQEAAALMVANFAEIVIAPGFDSAALAVFAAKPNLRVITAQPPKTQGDDIRLVEGGALVQERDQVELGAWETKHAGDEGLENWMSDLELAWTIAAHTKSNAIVLVSDGAAAGVGAGDQSRVGAVSRALAVAGDRANGAVAASDAFFPFRDAVDQLANGGVIAIVEPGGSMRDDDVIAAAVEHNIALFFTGRRHFLH